MHCTFSCCIYYSSRFFFFFLFSFYCLFCFVIRSFAPPVRGETLYLLATAFATIAGIIDAIANGIVKLLTQIHVSRICHWAMGTIEGAPELQLYQYQRVVHSFIDQMAKHKIVNWIQLSLSYLSDMIIVWIIDCGNARLNIIN